MNLHGNPTLQSARRLSTMIARCPHLADQLDHHLAKLKDVQDKIARLDRGAAPITSTRPDTTTAVLAALDTDETPDLLPIMAAALEHERTVEFASDHLNAIKTRLEEQAEHIADAAWADIPAALDAQLKDIVSQARDTHPAIANTPNAEAAINQDKAKEWHTWQCIADAYHAAREAQALVVNSSTLSREYSLVANTEHYEWAMAALVTDAEHHAPNFVPESHALRGQEPWLDLRWIASHPEVEAWVPTPEQLGDRLRAIGMARDALEKLNKGWTRRLTETQTHYLRTTGHLN